MLWCPHWLPWHQSHFWPFFFLVSQFVFPENCEWQHSRLSRDWCNHHIHHLARSSSSKVSYWFVVAIAIHLIFFGCRYYGVSWKKALVGLIERLRKCIDSIRRGIDAFGLLWRLYHPTVTILLKVTFVRESCVLRSIILLLLLYSILAVYYILLYILNYWSVRHVPNTFRLVEWVACTSGIHFWCRLLLMLPHGAYPGSYNWYCHD